MNQQLINFTEQAEPNLALYAMIRGAKNYELTNHLGNVLTTISDKKIAVCTNGVFSHYIADVLTATDYSAFGAPLPQRMFNYKENLNKVLVTQNQFYTATELNDWTATNGTRTFTNNSLQYSTTNSTASVSRNFATQTSKTYRLTFTIDVGTAGTISLAVLGYNGAAIVNGSIGQSGMQQLDFVANSTTTTLRLTINTGSGTRTLYLDNVKLEEVNGDLGGYRFGFQGQEQDDQVSGDGNSYTAEFWQYDARLGRRFNIDPKPHPSISVYACFVNNSICFRDVKGDTIRISLFNYQDRFFYNIAKDMGDGKDDGVFLVTAHGWSGGISDDSKILAGFSKSTPDGINLLLSSISPIWKEGMEKQRPMVLILLACNTASKDYLNDHTSVSSMVYDDIPIAYEISKQFSNLTVVALDGFVRYGRNEDGVPIIAAIRNYKGNGGLLEIKNGIRLYKTFYIPNIRPFRVKIPHLNKRPSKDGTTIKSPRNL